ncbi:MAG: NAD-dependent epimerase/dehydratase family protein [Kiritimatiellae bacterium]|jgi:nucleoside-diphosphate-sugar epimerase|nr:NAD-dependent epimerase/dehydratase family protein [Kiritimatiellia bacterium]
MRTALIIGGTGLLGRGIAAELLQNGIAVTVLTRGEKPLPTEIAGCDQVFADRKQPGSLENALKDRVFDCVVDCAAYDRVDAEQAVNLLSGNVGHYWFISTDFVYDADPAACFPVREDAKKNQGLPYASGKVEAEELLCRAAREKKFPVTILRPPHILGVGRPAGCDPAAGGRDAQLVQRLKAGETLPLLANGQLLIQPVWSREVGRCVRELSGNADTFGEVFNLAGSECVTTGRYYEIVADCCGVSLKTRNVELETYMADHPDQTHLGRHRIYDLRKLEAVGFHPALELKDALQDTLRPYFD